MYPLKFKAAILEQNNSNLYIDQITFEGPLKIGQVLVKVEYSGICGKQIEEISGKMGPDPFLPHLLGHEGFGEVIECGPGVKTVKPTEKVVMHWKKGTGIDSETPFYKWRNNKVNAGWITTFNEYAVVSENRLTKMPNNTNGEIACLLGCAVTTGIGAVINEANTKPFHSVAICGCGGVGLNCIYGAKLINAAEIYAFDKNQKARNLAVEFGANKALSPNYDKKYSFDKVFVTASNKDAIEFSFSICKDGGQIFVIGVPSPDIEIRLNALSLHRDRSFHGSNGGGITPEIDIPCYYNLHTKNIINLELLISKVIKLDDINLSINDIINNNVIGRHIINFN